MRDSGTTGGPDVFWSSLLDWVGGRWPVFWTWVREFERAVVFIAVGVSQSWILAPDGRVM
jgi:hypothetical protein